MKKILLLILAINVLTSCNEDFLDLEPLDKISEISVWEDPKLIQAFVNAQYNAILGPFDKSRNSFNYYSDESYTQHNFGLSWEYAQRTITPDNVTSLYETLNYWTAGYNYIRNLNLFFEAIENSPVEESAKSTMIAEMKFIRAFIYSRLLWNYGGVPIIEKAFDLDENLTGVKRNSYQEVLDYILNDLNDVIATLPEKQTGANAGRASGDAALALKARLLLYDASPLNNPTNSLEKWQAASDASAAVIGAGYTLYPDYDKLFLADGNSEVIFQRYYNPENFSNFNRYGSTPGNGGYGYYAPTQNLVDAFEMSNGELPFLADGSVNPVSGYDPANPYVNRDPRFYMVVLYNGAMCRDNAVAVFPGGRDHRGNDATPTGYHLRKFMNETIKVADPTVTPWIFFRLTEFYLNFAEAQYHLGNEDVTRTNINLVRDRAGMPDITDTGDALLVRIQHERQVELAYEGHRFYDIRRWKIAPEVESLPLLGTRVTETQPGEFDYTRFTIMTRTWEDKYYYLPIPEAEIRKSDNSLEQNPGW